MAGVLALWQICCIFAKDSNFYKIQSLFFCMRHFILLISTIFMLLISSCVSQPSFGHSTAYLDYKKYSDQGFFVTEAMSAPFEYSSVGSISVVERSGVDPTSSSGQSMKADKMADMDGVYAKRPKASDKYRFATAESALDAVVQRAKVVGANGIIGLRINEEVRNGIPCVIVSGMLINR
ncbi:hypothetical protein [Paramuribaculum intestinale]|uniref:hypothetical protein n=1 Tax=Paramuribaculum intestinale TaxID=2094151 RepID=UPI0025A955EC|nr:hypothetical protein [Paramuribaculum intestinale]